MSRCGALGGVAAGQGATLYHALGACASGAAPGVDGDEDGGDEPQHQPRQRGGHAPVHVIRQHQGEQNAAEDSRDCQACVEAEYHAREEQEEYLGPYRHQARLRQP